MTSNDVREECYIIVMTGRCVNKPVQTEPGGCFGGDYAIFSTLIFWGPLSTFSYLVSIVLEKIFITWVVHSVFCKVTQLGKLILPSLR